MKLPRLLLTILSSLLLGSLAQAQAIKIGVTPGSVADSVQVAAVEARKQGLDVKVVEFTDWTTPNAALDSGDIDLNYFQHQAFLDNAIRERGYKLTSIGTGVLSNIGLFSYKVKRFEDLKEGARVGIANDPVNQGRGLLLLEKAGLIRLRDSKGWRGTIDDIVANPKKLKIVELEAAQLPRSLEDVDLAIINNTFAGQIGLTPTENGLFVEDKESPYVNLIVARENNKDDEKVKEFVQSFQTDEVFKKGTELFKGGLVKGW